MNKIKKLYIKNKIKLRKWLFRTALFGTVVGGGTALFTADSPDTIKKANIRELYNYSMVEAFKYGLCNSIGDYIDKSHFVVDTVQINKANLESGTAVNSKSEMEKAARDSTYKFTPRHTLAIYRYENGKKVVALKYFVADTISEPNLSAEDKKRIIDFVTRNNNVEQQRSMLSHEFVHQGVEPSKVKKGELKVPVRKKDLFDFNVDIYHDAKLCSHNEIAANIGTLLYQRERYLETGDISVFTGHSRAYAWEIKKGRIDPKSTDPEAKKAEKLFIFKSVFNNWLKHDQDYYGNYTKNKIDGLDKTKKYNKIVFDNEQYKDALDVAYTFIMDGELTNLNFISSGEIKDLELKPDVTEHIEKKEADKKMSAIERFNLMRKRLNYLSGNPRNP